MLKRSGAYEFSRVRARQALAQRFSGCSNTLWRTTLHAVCIGFGVEDCPELHRVLFSGRPFGSCSGTSVTSWWLGVQHLARRQHLFPP